MDTLIEPNITWHRGWKADDKTKLSDLFEKAVATSTNKE